ncbi:MAG: hypothetical protein LBT25_05325 [Candidatus Symbiothrix sp.]|jgi:hypothetical protein|nr:hypothetical protein [Candidatus Symbiothrix sp.]
MKTKSVICFLFLLFLFSNVGAQTNTYYDFECGTTETMLRSSTSVGYSANGYPFTPKGDLRALVICAGFGSNYDSQYVSGWDSAPDSIPISLKNGDIFYSNFSQFTSNPPASAIGNISAYYHAMSRGQFRLVVDVYPKRINITPETEGWAGAAKKVINQMKAENPNFDWSIYDNRQNVPAYQSDNSNSLPDMKPDYVIIIYRYSKSFINSPYPTQVIPGDAYARIDFDNSINYNGYTFNPSCGYTQFTGGGYFSTLFIHEVAHTLYDAPHVSGVNTVTGDYVFIEKGWSQMDQNYVPFVSSNAWERWYLDWIDGIKANGTNADIKSASDMNTSGEYVLRDFVSTGDAMRIKIPNGVGKNEYLWLENHQGITIFDNQLIAKDGCDNNFPASPRGIVAYIESISDDKNNPGNLFYTNPSGIKYLHGAGNFDYTYQNPPEISCWYNNDVYNFHQAAINPISGQCGAQEIKFDFNNNNLIDFCNHANSGSQCYPPIPAKEDNKVLIKKDGNFTYDFLNGERAFAAGRKLSMASNPCLINRPKYESNGDKMGIYYLNGISVSVLNYDANGSARVKVQYKDVDITNDTRYAGIIYLPDITSDANPDINIMSNFTLHVDKSGTPNKKVKTSLGDFINPTEFKCLTSSFFKQSTYSKVFVENGSSLFVENGAKYEVNSNAELAVKSGSNFTVKSGGNLILKNSAQFSVELGATLTIEPGDLFSIR